MSEFWMWFLRPFGEFLGPIALVVGVILFVFVAAVAVALIQAAANSLKAWKERRANG